MKERFSSGDGAQKNPFEKGVFSSLEVGVKETRGLLVPEWKELSGEESKRVLAKTIATERGSFRYKQSHDVQKEDIRETGLVPKAVLAYEGRTFAFSECYMRGRGARNAFLVYGKKEEKYAPYTWYESQSHGLWNYMPGDDGGHIHKPVEGEESVRISLPVQAALAQIEKAYGIHPFIYGKTKKELFEAAGRVFADPASRTEGGKDAFDLEKPVLRPKPLNLPARKIVSEGRKHISEYAKRCDFLQGEQDPEHPDFSRPRVEWSVKTKHHKPLYKEVFSSHDEKLWYLINRTEAGEAWIGQIECADAELYTTGYRKEFVIADLLTFPVLVHDTDLLSLRFDRDVVKFRNQDKRVTYGSSLIAERRDTENYQNVFHQFHIHQPVIMRYLEAAKQRIPGFEEALHKRLQTKK